MRGPTQTPSAGRWRPAHDRQKHKHPAGVSSPPLPSTNHEPTQDQHSITTSMQACIAWGNIIFLYSTPPILNLKISLPYNPLILSSLYLHLLRLHPCRTTSRQTATCLWGVGSCARQLARVLKRHPPLLRTSHTGSRRARPRTPRGYSLLPGFGKWDEARDDIGVGARRVRALVLTHV